MFTVEGTLVCKIGANTFGRKVGKLHELSDRLNYLARWGWL
jgi:hypothetical protein